MGLLIHISKTIKILLKSNKNVQDSIIISSDRRAELNIQAPKHFKIEMVETRSPEQQAIVEARGNKLQTKDGSEINEDSGNQEPENSSRDPKDD